MPRWISTRPFRCSSRFRPRFASQGPGAPRLLRSLFAWLTGVAVTAGGLAATALSAAEPQTLTLDLSQATLAKPFVSNIGTWFAKDGQLVGSEVEADHHAAAARWLVPVQDGVIRFKVQRGTAKAVHVGFDPVPGTIKKKGHLYSLILTPQQAELRIHKDKADSASKEQVVSKASINAGPDTWIAVELATRGTKASATLNVVTDVSRQTIKLEGVEAAFATPKPGIVFRVAGGEACFKDVTLDVENAGPPAPAAADRKPPAPKTKS